MSSSRTVGAVLIAGAFVLGATAAAFPSPPRGEGRGEEQDASLDKLAWMAGTWTGEKDGIRMEEHWTDPRGGLMLGIHRDVAKGKAVFFEFLRIEATPKGPVYLAMPKGRSPATPFTAIEVGESRVVFENREHDFPQRILYWQTSDGSLHARVEGPKDGKTVSEEWTWERAR